MASSAAIQKMKERADQADKIISDLRNQIDILKQAAVLNAGKGEEEQLRKENENLKKEIETVKKHLIMAEIKNGIKQISVPMRNISTTASVSDSSQTGPDTQETEPVAAKSQKSEAKKEKTKPEKKAGDAKGKTASEKSAEAGLEKMDVSRLDFRIGKVLSAKKHPDADTLYIEDVDLGEDKTRTVVSGLVKFVPLEEMQGRLAVFMCNLKPAKMRGILSEGMIMCASAPEKIEILVPPPGVRPGDRVSFEGYSGEPDTQLNPKKKIWETLKPDIRTNENKVATYKGTPFKIEGKGIVEAPTLANSQIS